jgi:hypothetical protein
VLGVTVTDRDLYVTIGDATFTGAIVRHALV